MNIFNVNKVPTSKLGVYACDTKSSDLDKWDLSCIKKNAPDWAVYWYTIGAYEGAGSILYMKNGLWYVRNLGHCSCYGPLEHGITYEGGYKSIGEMIDGGSEAFNHENRDLFDYAIAHRKDWV